MTRRRALAARSLVVAATLLAAAIPAASQSITYRGFVEARGAAFPQEAPNDPRRVVVDLLGRGDLFVTAAPWLQLAGGLDLRASPHDRVEEQWQLDWRDRSLRRAPLSVRRLAATMSYGPLTIDAGKQFIRWGKADIVTPTDRFAPRDFLNVLDAEFVAVTGVRGVLALGAHTLDAVWVPVFTPSRLPLLEERWSPVPAGVAVAYAEPQFPDGSQGGVRLGHIVRGVEYALTAYAGYNHLPDIDTAFDGIDGFRLVRTYPVLRMYGADAAVPSRWFTVKGEVAYFGSPTPGSDEYVLYVLQLERQVGEWLLIGGYAGEAVTDSGTRQAFAPDRGTTRTLLGRAAYTISPTRSAAVEAAARQDGRGLYIKGEYSLAAGQRWRTTVTGALIRGEAGDFIGQYRRNSHVGVALRYSY